MAVSGKPRSSANYTVTFADGTGTPVTLVLANDTKIDVTGLTGRALNEIGKAQRRGKHYGTYHGQRIYPQVTIEFIHDGWKGVTSAPGTPLEFATFQGIYSANVSTIAGGTRSHKTIDIRIAGEGTDYGDANDDSLILTDCLLVEHGLLSDADPATYSMTFDVLGPTEGDLVYAQI